VPDCIEIKAALTRHLLLLAPEHDSIMFSS